MHYLLLSLSNEYHYQMNIIIVVVAEQIMTAGNLVKTVGLVSWQTSIEWPLNLSHQTSSLHL